MSTENRRNPGAGKKRLYSGLDIARVAAMQALTRLGVSASAAATITGRIESGQTADARATICNEKGPYQKHCLRAAGVWLTPE